MAGSENAHIFELHVSRGDAHGRIRPVPALAVWALQVKPGLKLEPRRASVYGIAGGRVRKPPEN